MGSLMISIQSVSVCVNNQQILNNVTLNLQEGTVTALMGPNGSGKSSLANLLAGNPEYHCVSGSVMIAGEDLLALSIEQRSLKGLFVLFQQVPAIPGLSAFTFLKEAVYAHTKKHQDLPMVEKQIFEYMDFLGLERSLLYRCVHDGFSGGEKKRFELLQLLVLKPRWIVLDEIDSGLDVDALKLVKKVIDVLREQNSSLIVLCITHYKRMTEYLQPSQVYILHQGAIVDAGSNELIEHIERYGYQHYAQSASSL